MVADAEPAAARFSAFLSYSHADSEFVKRLHRKLESYRLPRRLRRDGKSHGQLAPLFMDRAELTAAPNLTESVREAIADSEYLIVVCSPAAAISAWVGREIELFRELHPGGTILTAICRGDMGSVFHEELFVAGAQGDRDPPIAADFRKGGDGDRLALLKLIAPLAGVRLDELVQRDAQRQAHRTMWVVVASTCGLAIAGELTTLLLDAQTRAQQEHARGERMIEHMLGDERTALKQVGRLDLLDGLNRDALSYFQGLSRGQFTDEDFARRAVLLQDMAEDDTVRGDFPAADAKAREALGTTAVLLAAHPGDPTRVYEHAQSEYWYGFVRRREGDEANAQAAFQQYADLASQLTRLQPANPDARLERAFANSNLATLLLQRNLDTQRAGSLFASAQNDLAAVARLRPNDRDLQVQVEDGDAWLAEVRRLSGDYDGALSYRLKQRSLVEALVAGDRHDFQARKRLVSNDLALGRLATARGDWRGALTHLRTAHDEALALVDTDPQNIDVAQQARAIELFEARAMMTAPPAQRPAPKEIGAMLGDCHADEGRPNHEELAAFCTILRARLMVLEGDPRSAASLLAPLKTGPLLRGERLSERWLIDWRSEMAN